MKKQTMAPKHQLALMNNTKQNYSEFITMDPVFFITQHEVPHYSSSGFNHFQSVSSVLLSSGPKGFTSSSWTSVSSGSQRSLQPSSEDDLRVRHQEGMQKCSWHRLCWCSGNLQT